MRTKERVRERGWRSALQTGLMHAEAENGLTYSPISEESGSATVEGLGGDDYVRHCWKGIASRNKVSSETAPRRLCDYSLART